MVSQSEWFAGLVGGVTGGVTPVILYSGGASGCGARRAVREGERWIRIGGACVTAASVQCVSRCRACLSEIQNQPVRTDVAG